MNKFALFALSAFGAFAAFAGDGVGGDEQPVGGTDIVPDSGDGTAGDTVVPAEDTVKEGVKQKGQKQCQKQKNKKIDKKAAADWTAKLNGDMGTKGEVVSGGEKDATVAQ